MKSLKNVLIAGYGKSGKSVERYLKDNKIKYKIYDEKINIDGGNYILDICGKEITQFDLIVLSPAIPIDSKLAKLAKKHKVKIISELEFGYLLLDSNLISVTGTNGKTTTVTLINEIIGEIKKSVTAGNIGVPLTEIALNGCKYDYVVCEVSSFQLEAIDKYRSSVNVFLNIGDDHLDRHNGLQEYIDAKGNMFKNNTEKTVNILNADDELVVENFKDVKGIKFYVSTKKEVQGVYVENDKIIINLLKNKHVFCDLNEFGFSKLFLTDILCAICVGVLMNIEEAKIIDKIKKFKMLNSRVEKVAVSNGVTYINDSKATNMHAVLSCVNSLDNDIILLLGGRNKGFNFKKLINALPKNVKRIVAFGESANQIIKCISEKSGIEYYSFSTLDEAINKAWAVAWEGSTVLLSPACSSFDEFNSYAERGEFFKNKVLKLIEQNG